MIFSIWTIFSASIWEEKGDFLSISTIVLKSISKDSTRLIFPSSGRKEWFLCTQGLCDKTILKVIFFPLLKDQVIFRLWCLRCWTHWGHHTPRGEWQKCSTFASVSIVFVEYRITPYEIRFRFKKKYSCKNISL